LKAEHQEAAQARNQKTVVFRKWEGGKPVGQFTKNGQLILQFSITFSNRTKGPPIKTSAQNHEN